MYAIPRKKRKSKSIEKSSKLFSKYLENQDYKKAASIVFWCVLKEFAQEGIINALDHCNSFYERKELRRG
ncbi:hypothetical protein ES707_02308 [subsurface metagenome]